MTYRALRGLSNTLYRNHLFFVVDFVKRIIHSAQSLGFAAGEDSNRGYLVRRPVDYCVPQGDKICIFPSRPWG